MKKIILAAIAITFALTTNVSAADLKIAVVDLNRAISMSKEGKRSKKFLENAAKAQGKELKKKEKNIIQLSKELQESLMLSPEAKKQKMKKLQRLDRELKAEVQAAQKKFQADQNRHGQKIIADLRTIVAQIAKKQKYDLVLERQLTTGVLFTSLNMADLTPAVVKAYDKIN